MIGKHYRYFAFFIFLSLASCQKEDTGSELYPENLIVEVNNLEDGSGMIEIVATADNAMEYQFYPGDYTTVDPVINFDGLFSHTYAATGIYLLEVRAYGKSGRYLKRDIRITVIVDDGPPDPGGGYSTPLSYDGMHLVFQDEFSSSSLNTTNWSYEIGTGSGGWGNNELQYYREENTSVSDGLLTIEARHESFGGMSYTSSRLITKDKFSFTYGRVDIRAVLPEGQGIWPALWMLGDNFPSVGWPACGEIDIMEMIGGGDGRDNVVHGTLHWDNNGSYANNGGNTKLSSGLFSDEFHVFTIKWNATTITWFLDDVQFHVADISPAAMSEFHQNAFFIFNVAVGGNWPGSPDASTIFPQQMIVDYIRVFQVD